MQLAVSAIAWPAGADRAAFKILAEYRIGLVEYVPARIGELSAFAAGLEPYGLQTAAMQALLFGTEGLALFENPAARSALDRHLRAICRTAGQCGCRALVFGSPKNRRYDPTLITPAEADRLAVDYFHELGKFACAHGTTVCIEPNPAAYGGNFLTGTVATADFVRRTATPGIRLNLDTGALMMNNEPPAATWGLVSDVVGHVHLSTPFLRPPDHASRPVHTALLRTLQHQDYPGAVSLEMATPADADWRAALLPALDHVAELFKEAASND